MNKEYKGLWEEDTATNLPITIYKVTEFYDWHNTNPDIDTTVFLGKGLAEKYMTKRMREIPFEVFDSFSLDELNITKNPDGSICIHNDNDYWTISIEKDEVVTSWFPCIYDLEKDYEIQREKSRREEQERIFELNRDDSFFYKYHPHLREPSLFELEK